MAASYPGRPPSTPTLPYEIQHQIIDILFGSDRYVGPSEMPAFSQTLLSCALVCRSWHRRVLWHQYQQVILDVAADRVSFRLPIPAPMPLGKLLDILDANSSLRTFIRSVVINGRRGDEQSNFGTDGRCMDQMLIRLCQDMAEQSMETVYLDFCEESVKSFPLRPGVLPSLRRLCSGPRLQSLTLVSHTPLSCLLDARHIKDLGLLNYLGSMEDAPYESQNILSTDPLTGGHKVPLFSSERHSSSATDVETRTINADARQLVESFDIDNSELSPNEAALSYERLSTFAQKNIAFATAISSLREAFCKLPSTPLPSTLAKIIFSETLQDISIFWTAEQLYLSQDATQVLRSIPWVSMNNLTTLSIDFSLGLNDDVWDVFPHMHLAMWEEHPSSDFLLACSHLPNLRNLRLLACINWHIIFTHRTAILGAINHIFKDSIDPYFVPPRFASLRYLMIGMGITVWDRDGDFDHDLLDGGLDKLVEKALPSVFGPDGRVANGLEVDPFSELDIKEDEQEDEQDEE